VKKLLIIQTDEAYFLFETLQMLDRYREALKDFEVSLYVDPLSLAQIEDGSVTLIPGITTDLAFILQQSFDISANFSLNETSWQIQHQIGANQKLGMIESHGQLLIPDAWSSYLLTLKGKAPFLTFHLQDLFKNILGIKRIQTHKKNKKNYTELVFGLFNTEFFPADEQENLINLVHNQYPHLPIKDISEVDVVSDLSHVLYIGPGTFDALKICEAGADGIFVGRSFQGFNLLPLEDGHYFVSTLNGKANAEILFKFVMHRIADKEISRDFPYAVYKIDEEHLFGSYLKSLNRSDESYPIYQCHVVLWNFLLNLFDTNLEIINCSEAQTQLLTTQVEVLDKLIRLYDYAMSSINTIHQQAKSSQADAFIIEGHLKNLREIETITDKISQSHVFLRPILDYYRIRRGQNPGRNLLEQSQDSFLLYSEEHQALKSLLELFTVTLQKNEVNI
jgi:hypothetical protein